MAFEGFLKGFLSTGADILVQEKQAEDAWAAKQKEKMLDFSLDLEKQKALKQMDEQARRRALQDERDQVQQLISGGMAFSGTGGTVQDQYSADMQTTGMGVPATIPDTNVGEVYQESPPVQDSMKGLPSISSVASSATMTEQPMMTPEPLLDSTDANMAMASPTPLKTAMELLQEKRKYGQAVSLEQIKQRNRLELENLREQLGTNSPHTSPEFLQGIEEESASLGIPVTPEVLKLYPTPKSYTDALNSVSKVYQSEDYRNARVDADTTLNSIDSALQILEQNPDITGISVSGITPQLAKYVNKDVGSLLSSQGLFGLALTEKLKPLSDPDREFATSIYFDFGKTNEANTEALQKLKETIVRAEDYHASREMYTSLYGNKTGKFEQAWKDYVEAIPLSSRITYSGGFKNWLKDGRPTVQQLEEQEKAKMSQQTEQTPATPSPQQDFTGFKVLEIN